MPKAEVGSTKYVANKMKAKGLQRLRWYCQVCSKQCRDENGFKQHTLSEGHVRQMMLVGEDPRKYITNYSNQFRRDFMQLLRTSHGEKKVYINHFYQEYIRDKEHVHMNSTRWQSLTEFAKFLGREGICRVEEGERGLQIQWIDDSPEAIKRREDIKNKERQAKGDEDLESRLLDKQVKRAREQAAKLEAAKAQKQPEEPTPPPVTAVENAGPIKFSFGLKKKTTTEEAVVAVAVTATDDKPSDEPAQPAAPPKFSLGLSSKPKLTNPLQAVKSPFASKKSDKVEKSAEPEKKMSAAERIMRDEIERKRQRDDRDQRDGFKRARYD